MRKNTKFIGMTAFALTAIGLASCQNELDGYVPGGDNIVEGVSLVKSPDIVAWSGMQTLGTAGSSLSTRGVNVNANEWSNYWDCVPNVDLSDEDIAELIRLFSKGEYTENTVILPFENYWVQQVYKGESTYNPTDINGNPVNGTSITGSNQMDKLLARNQHYEAAWVPENNYDGSEILVEYDHVNNFNYGDNTNNPGQCGCGIVHKGTTLMVDMSTEGITPNNQFGFHESYGTSHNYNNYIILQYKGEWYVGFDYEMHKSEAQNGGEAKNVERDWNFTDWIVKITPAYQKGSTPPANDDTVKPTPPVDGDDDPVVDPDDGDGDDDDDDEIVTNPGNVLNKHGKEVEVNYAILDSHPQYGLADLVTKLSIHVRKATNVDIKIPIPGKYLVESDDLYIFQEHYTGSYGGESNLLANKNARVELEIGESVVVLHVDFEAGNESLGEAFKDGYIRVWTEGIDQNVIDYCWENNKDGINFEVYNYFQTAEVLWNPDVPTNIVRPIEDVNREELITLMNQATIKFTNDNPDYFINAFGANDDKTDKHDWHATVTPERDLFDLRYEQTTHLNGTPYNDIWVRKGAQVDETHKH